MFAWLQKLLGFSENAKAEIPASDEPFDYPKIEHRPYQPLPSPKPLIYQPRPPATRAATGTAKRRQDGEEDARRRRNTSDDYDYTPFMISSGSNSYSSGSDTSSYSSHSSCGSSSDSGSSSCGGGGE